MKQIAELRTLRVYKLLEATIGVSSISFLVIILLLSFFERNIVSVFLITYSFMWVLKFCLNALYTIYTYKQLHRWETLDWEVFLNTMSTQPKQAIEMLTALRDKFKSKIDWSRQINEDIQHIQTLQGTKYAHPQTVFHIAIFSVYNEPADVIMRSLERVFQSGYDITKLLVVITQEQRVGKEHNESIRLAIAEDTRYNTFEFQESDLDIVYSKQHATMEYTKKIPDKRVLKENILNVMFTEHPDGLVGEIKGKASNEDWAGRQASLWVKSQDIDQEMILVTSLDADSGLSRRFFDHLSYRFCLTDKRYRSGFQPVHAYSNNYYQTGLWQRQVAAENTISNMKSMGIIGEGYLFAIYSVPLVTLQTVDFWVREVIAEDSMLHIKCYCEFNGDFLAVPFFGTFEGDAVEDGDYLEAIISQYKQLQRWAWGGIENFPYMFYRFFIDPRGSTIDLRDRIRHICILFLNHFYWATTAILFSIGVVLPSFIGGQNFVEQPIAQNMSIFFQYFVWIGYFYSIIFAYITYRLITYKISQRQKIEWYYSVLSFAQWLFFPIIFGLMSFPALDAQIRGIRGKYLGYWVTPKK